MNPAAFSATRWTLVAQARGTDDAGRAALSDLCAAYYAPVVAFLRREGREEDAARELAHGFFASLLEGGGLRGADPARGRFRNYLLGAVKHFLRDERVRAAAEKRGGGHAPVPLEEAGGDSAFVEESAAAAERAFDRQWALTIIARALEVLEQELTAAGKAAQFGTLKPWLTGAGEVATVTGAAAVLQLSEGAVKVAIHRLRQRFRDAVKDEIARAHRPGGERCGGRTALSGERAGAVRAMRFKASRGDELAHHPEQVLRFERLVEHMIRAGLRAFVLRRHVEAAGDDDGNPRGGAGVLQRPQRAHPVPSRHHDIHDDELRPFTQREGRDVAPVAGENDVLVAGGTQDFLNEPADRRLVIHHENPPAAPHDRSGNSKGGEGWAEGGVHKVGLW